MQHYVVYLIGTGEIIMSSTVPDGMSPSTTIPGAATAVTPHAIDGDTHRVDLNTGNISAYSGDGVKRKRSNTNGRGFTWDPATEDWIDERPLNDVRADVLARLRNKRDALLEGGFTWDGSEFDSDTAVSQPRLLGLFATAISGGIPASGYPWRLKDNSWRVLSAADAIAVWRAFQSNMASLFAAFAVHEATVTALTSADALRAYDVEAGWS